MNIMIDNLKKNISKITKSWEGHFIDNIPSMKYPSIKLPTF